MQKSDLRVTEEVVQKAFALGLDPAEHEYGLYGQLLDMVNSAAPITHPKGTRRYNEWIFSVKGDVVIGVHLIRCSVCDDRRRVQVFDECPLCHGSGCDACKGRGKTLGFVPCQSCTT